MKRKDNEQEYYAPVWHMRSENDIIKCYSF